MTRALDIKQAVITRLQSGMTTVPGASIFSSRSIPFEREDLPAINVRLGECASRYENMGSVEHELEISIEISTRGTAPDDLAEPIRSEVSALIFADTTLGGLCLWVRPAQTLREIDDADQDAAKVTDKFFAVFRLPPGSV